MIARDAVDLTLEVSVELDAQRRHFAVTKDKPEILVPPDAQLEIGIEGFESSVRVPYTRTADGDAVLVEPELPALAYVALTYPVPDDVDTSRPGVEIQVERGSWRFPPRKLRPGVALIGPVPPGEYVIRRIWYSRTESRWIADSKGPLAFGEGHAVLAWE